MNGTRQPNSVAEHAGDERADELPDRVGRPVERRTRPAGSRAGSSRTSSESWVGSLTTRPSAEPDRATTRRPTVGAKPVTSEKKPQAGGADDGDAHPAAAVGEVADERLAAEGERGDDGDDAEDALVVEAERVADLGVRMPKALRSSSSTVLRPKRMSERATAAPPVTDWAIADS